MIYNVEGIHLEPSQLCQASCPMCDRNMNGEGVNKHLSDQSLSLEQCKKIFSPEFISQLKYLFMCGNHGDPIFAPDCLEIMQYFREHNPNMSLKLITNGGARKPEWWEELAKVVTLVEFSVDGLEDTNHFYRQGVNWRNVENNMQAFTDAGGNATWTFIVFNYNEHQVEEAREYAQLLGVNNFIVKKSGRYINSYSLQKRETHQAVSRKGEETTLLAQPKNPIYHNKAVNDYDTIIEKYGSMDNFIEIADISPKCAKKKEIYVSAEGHIMPCCWTHGQMYKWWRPIEDSQEYKILEENGGIDSINALKRPLEDILNGSFFSDIEKRWNIKGIDNGRMRTCGLKCNVGFDPYKAQWQ
jgi:MoaA/NifB/PqqE/SkfB family radical SAM enzyme